jgi:hypothetical protein
LAAAARLPLAVTGPRDLAPLAREAAIWSSVRGSFITATEWHAPGRVFGVDVCKLLILWGIF